MVIIRQSSLTTMATSERILELYLGKSKIRVATIRTTNGIMEFIKRLMMIKICILLLDENVPIAPLQDVQTEKNIDNLI